MAGLFQAQEPMWGRLDGFTVFFFKDEAMIYDKYISSIDFFCNDNMYIYICWFSFLRHGEGAIMQ